MSASTTYRDRLESLVATIADDLVRFTGSAARNYGIALSTARDTVQRITAHPIPDDGVILTIADLTPDEDGGWLRMTTIATPHPDRATIRRAERVYSRGEGLTPAQLLAGAVEHLPGTIEADPRDPETHLLCHAVVAGLLAANREISEEVVELRADPESWPMLMLVGAPKGGLTALYYGVPCPTAAAPPSFKDLMTELEQGGRGDG